MVRKADDKLSRGRQEYPNPRRGKEIIEHLRKATGGNYQMTTEEVMRLTRGEDWGTGRLEEGDGVPIDPGPVDSNHEE